MESLAIIDSKKESSAVRAKDASPSGGEHILTREVLVSRDETTVRTNSRTSGAPAIERSGSHDESHMTEETTHSIKPKLPKIVLPKFNGEVTKFRAFWDSFESAVDKNPSLSAVDKFNYLNALLEGTAAQSIQGLSLSDANYTAATEILKERFGKSQAIISAHMENLLQIPACVGDKSSHLRTVYDKLKSMSVDWRLLG